MNNLELIPLHTHSNYSLLDSMIKIKDYVKWGKENNMPALALTDHGVLSGSLRFFKECKANDIKPILGLEAYMTFDTPDEPNKTRDNYHIILLAKNKNGWLNLIKLHNLSYHNFFYRPRIRFEDLEKHSEGLICCSACLGGLLPKLILAKNQEKLFEYTKRFQTIFGEDFYIELQDHNLPEQRPVNLILLKIANMFNIKVIATNDAHYNSSDDAFAHQVLLCKQTHSKISNPSMKFDSNEFYLKNTDEMRRALYYIEPNIMEQIILNTNEIANKIEEYDILQYEYNYPKFGETSESLKKLIALSSEGFKNRFAGKNINKQEYVERLKYELETIYKIGFVDYFLVLSDLYKFLEEKNIGTGFGRGSGAGSLVLYCLGATHLDPIKNNLLFERFINPDRISAPDVDCDIEDIRRDEVIDYLENRYGVDKVCNIATYGELTSVASFKAVASVLEMPFMEANNISKNLLNTHLSLDENLSQSPELQKMYNTNTDFKKIFDTAKRLEGGIDKRGVHACGVVIANQPLENLSPIMYIDGADGKKVNCSAFEMKEIDGDLKLLKLDILGLKNLSIVKDAISRIDEDIDFKALDFEDEKTYDLIKKGNTLGIFQIESEVMKKLCRDIQPENLADLSAINAGARPGSLESGLTESFINRRKGLEEIDYVCDGMEPYLKETLGTFMYQEQVMQLSRVMAGYTMGQADGLRKIIGKKMLDKLPAEREKFIKGALANGHTEARASEIFDMIEKFGRYGFNASHSYAYSALSYTTAYLKANYPLEYMTALLNANSDNFDKLTPYIDECYRLGINVLPPDINKSSNIFEHDKLNNAIRFGFNGIKGVGESSILPIITERKNGYFSNLKDLLNRIPSINKTTVENLIKCGALNNIEKSPYKYLNALEYTSKAKNKADYKKGKISYYDMLIRCFVEDLVKKNSKDYQLLAEENKSIKGTKKEDKEKKDINKAQMENIIASNIINFENCAVNPHIQEIRRNEIEIMGFPISSNPKKQIIELENFIDNTNIYQIKESKDYFNIYSFMGRIKKATKTKNGSYMLILTDDIDDVTTFVKKETYLLLEELINQQSNYFRIYAKLNKSFNPDKFDDNLKLEGIRFFNASKDSEITFKSDLDIPTLTTCLTEIKECGMINSDDINYKLNILVRDRETGEYKKMETKIDFWIKDIQSIADIVIKYNLVKV